MIALALASFETTTVSALSLEKERHPAGRVL